MQLHVVFNVTVRSCSQYAAREAEIVAQAGRKNAITISTNMAGRGTDIILGGNPEVCSQLSQCSSGFHFLKISSWLKMLTLGEIQMLAKEVLEARLLQYMTNEAPDIDTDGAPLSQMVNASVDLNRMVSTVPVFHNELSKY